MESMVLKVSLSPMIIDYIVGCSTVINPQVVPAVMFSDAWVQHETSSVGKFLRCLSTWRD